MCIIAVCNERKLTQTELYYCWKGNFDGAGIAWVNQGKHYYKKGFMGHSELWNYYKCITVLPHIVHFRTGTAGAIIPELTHPFICRENSPLKLQWRGEDPLLFHNGVVSDYEYLAVLLGIPLNDKFSIYWSDTRVLSKAISLWDHNFLSEERGRFALFIGGKVLTYGAFIAENGILFSNTGYQPWFFGGYYYGNVVAAKRNYHKYGWTPSRNIWDNTDESESPFSGTVFDCED